MRDMTSELVKDSNPEPKGLSTESRSDSSDFKGLPVSSQSLPMYIRTIGVLLLVVSGLVAGLPAQSKTFPVSELKPGMVATGRTVFQGDQLEEFKAHILGVLHNSIGPRRDLILARLEGGPLANTGVIAGMSGSPVYIDGRLVGAVSYSLGEFAKEPLAGITPIEEMIADATLPDGQRRAQVAPALLTLPVTQEGLRDSLRHSACRLEELPTPATGSRQDRTGFVWSGAWT